MKKFISSIDPPRKEGDICVVKVRCNVDGNPDDAVKISNIEITLHYKEGFISPSITFEEIREKVFRDADRMLREAWPCQAE